MQFRHRGNRTPPKTQNNGENFCSLVDLCEGEHGIIMHFEGGFGLVRRLAEMGLTPGVEVKLIRKGPFRGPMEIEVRGVALALGCGVASKILVKPLKEKPNG